MLRRLAAALMLLSLAAPLGAHAQGHEQHGRQGGWSGGGFQHGGYSGAPHGGYGGPGGQGGPRGGGYAGPHSSGFEPGHRGGGRGPYPEDGRGERERRGPMASGGRGPFGGPGGPGAERLARGQFLPPEARGAVVQDFDRFHLRRPPRGYYWYRAGEDYVMASTANGMIFEVIPADPY